MTKVIIKGKEIKTNLGATTYPVHDGSGDRMHCEIKPDFRMSDEEFVEYLVDKGYTTISLKRGTTCVRGYYSIFAMVNNRW